MSENETTQELLPRYAKDNGQRMTIGEILGQLRAIPVANDFRDKVDDLFFDGA